MAGLSEHAFPLNSPNPKDQAPEGMVRLKMQIAYDGAAFAGWQSQAGKNAVQDAIELALANIVGQRIVVHGAGRTDSGVHALGQVAHIDVPKEKFAANAWAGAINAQLPRTVRILCATRAAKGFHARFSSSGKLYTYRIWNHRFQNPLEKGRAWHVASPIDRATLKALCEMFTGKHDFAAFAANRGKTEKSTVRTMHKIRLIRDGNLLSLSFQGEGFLYRMVRLMSGSMVRVAQGKQTPEWLQGLLEAPGGRKSSFCAPAEGLTLVKVFYRKSTENRL
jgi:tRNA pseudouridine38-40 synthase